MAEFNCKDINGLDISQFVFNDDGTVSGIVVSGSSITDGNTSPTTTTYTNTSKGGPHPTKGGPISIPYDGQGDTTLSPISEQCCSALNFIWESSTNTCFWSQPCDEVPDFKVVLGAKGNDGALFQVDENEICHLEVKFDYLFQFACEDLQTCMEEQSIGIGELVDAQTDETNKEEDIILINQNIDELTQQIVDIKESCNDTITTLTNDINTKQNECDIIAGKVVECQIAIDTDATKAQGIAFTAQLVILQAQLLQCNSELDLLNQTLTITKIDCDNQIANLEATLTSYNTQLSICTSELEAIQNTVAELEANLPPTSDGVANCLDFFEKLDVCVTIDRLAERGTGTGSYVNNTDLITEYEEQLFKVDNIANYFDGNLNTGLYVTGSSTCMQELNQCVIHNLSGACGVLSASTLNSDWVQHSFIISDESVLSAITNEKIKLGFLVKDCECDFSILIDRVELNRICTKKEKDEIFISTCPSFEIERVCDNKKSWVAEEVLQEREFFLTQRETDYDINDHRLAINTKEVDLDISPANAIETDMWCYIKDNETLLDCSTGTTATTFTCSDCLTGFCGDVNLNINELLTTEVSAMTTVKEFGNVLCSELIDVKNRKTISAYPTLRALYERYKNGFQGLPTSSGYDYFKMNDFIKLVGDYWVDLIEQVIPSTTIWGSTIKLRNTIFDKDKFVYKKYTLFTCQGFDNIEYPSPTNGSESSVETITVDIGIPVFDGPDCLAPTGETTVCTGVIIQQIDAGSEFIGTVNVLGQDTSPSGNTLVINECDLIINNIVFDMNTSRGTGSAIPTYAGGVPAYSYLWEIDSSLGQLSSWSIITGTETEEVVQLSGASIDLAANDFICMKLTITDSEDCHFQLTKCFNKV